MSDETLQQLPFSEILKHHLLKPQERQVLIAKQPNEVKRLAANNTFSDIHRRFFQQKIIDGPALISPNLFEPRNQYRVIADAVPKQRSFTEKPLPEPKPLMISITNEGRIKIEGMPVSFDPEKIIAACVANERKGAGIQIMYPHLDNQDHILYMSQLEFSVPTFQLLFVQALKKFSEEHQHVLSQDKLLNINTDPNVPIQLEKENYAWLSGRFNQMRDLFTVGGFTDLDRLTNNLPFGAVVNGAWEPNSQREIQAFKQILRLFTQLPFKYLFDYLNIEDEFKKNPPPKKALPKPAAQPKPPIAPAVPQMKPMVPQQSPQPGNRPDLRQLQKIPVVPPRPIPAHQPAVQPRRINTLAPVVKPIAKTPEVVQPKPPEQPQPRDLDINISREPHLVTQKNLGEAAAALAIIFSTLDLIQQGRTDINMALTTIKGSINKLFPTLPQQVTGIRFLNPDGTPWLLFTRKEAHAKDPFVITIDQALEVHQALKNAAGL
jgi:hypothetical protein